MNHTLRSASAAFAGLALVGSLAACGGNATSTTGTGGNGQVEVEATDEIVTAGQDAAEAAGGSIELPDKTVGWIYYGANGIASQRSYDGLQAAADEIGWTVKPCDGQGIPVEMQRCASNLLNQKVDALVVNTIDTATMADAIKQATAAGVPIISVGGAIENTDGYAASYNPDEAAMGASLGEYVAEQLPDGGGVIEQTFPATFSTLRTDAFEGAIEGTDVTIADTFDADPVDLTAATQRQTAAALSSHADAKAVTMVFSTAEIGASQALVTKYGADAAFPDRPLLTTYYANLPVIDMIRKGQLDAAAENSLEWCGWVAIDQLAEFFARDTPIDTAQQPDYGDGLDFWRPTVVTKDNMPPEGELLTPVVDFDGFFTAKWAAEFGGA